MIISRKGQLGKKGLKALISLGWHDKEKPENSLKASMEISCRFFAVFYVAGVEQDDKSTRKHFCFLLNTNPNNVRLFAYP